LDTNNVLKPNILLFTPTMGKKERQQGMERKKERKKKKGKD
jgi:hypothetical protein